MKKTFLVLAVLGLCLAGRGQKLYEYYVELPLRDTVYWLDEELPSFVDKSGKAWFLGFDLDEVANGCADAVLNIGGEMYVSSSISYSIPFDDSRLPYTIAAADTSLQDDGSYRVVQGWWIDKSPVKDVSIILDQGTCPDTLNIGVYIFQPSR